MNSAQSIPVKSHRLRNGLLGLLLIALVIVAGYAFRIEYNEWYAEAYRLEIALSHMHTSIRNGDSVEDLEVHLGPGQVMEPDEVPGWLLRNASSWPDGYRDGDQFVKWEIENDTLNFQFRDGKLINHNPANYTEPDVVKVIQ